MAKPNSEKLTPARKQAFDKLNIPHSNRVILSLDGGGMRGIFTLQLLKKLEEIAGIRCCELFDMVAGTSTGGIIAGLIATGHSAAEIEELYTKLITSVFQRKLLGLQFVNPPAYSKRNYRHFLKEIITDVTLEKTCTVNEIDLMITAHDISAGEETFFSCFKQDDGSYYGTYNDALLRSVMEATMSAPTYFHPLERFLDGGTTTYNNPSFAAFMEAVSYSRADKNANLSDYQIPFITLFSFGTGISRQFIQPEKTLRWGAVSLKFWLKWIMSQTGYDASAMQTDAFRSPLMENTVDFRRFQISLDPAALKKLPNTDELNPVKYGSPWLHNLTAKHLNDIDLADIKKMDIMSVIGKQMATYIVESGNAFQSDLTNNRKNDQLVTYFGDITRIKKQMSNAKWLDEFAT